MRRRTMLLLLVAVMMNSATAAEPPAQASGLSWTNLTPLPDVRGVAGAFAGVTGNGNDVLVVGGGANFPDQPPWAGGTKAWHATTYVLSAPDAAWLTTTSLPRPLGYGVSASYGGRVWCVGGGDAAEHVQSTVSLEWDATAQKLRVEPDALPPLPQAMAFGSGVLVGSRLYIAGGQATPPATEALGTFWSIDLAVPAPDRRWDVHPAGPGPKRILPVLGTSHDKVYLVSGAKLMPATATGGTGNTAVVTRRFLTDAFEFAPSQQSWRVIADCPVPLVAAPCPAIRLDASLLAFLPGDDGLLFLQQKELAGNHPGFPRKIYLYDTIGNVWRAAGTVPDDVRPAVTTPTVAWRGGWIIPTGEVQSGLRSPQVVRVMPVLTNAEPSPR